MVALVFLFGACNKDVQDETGNGNFGVISSKSTAPLCGEASYGLTAGQNYDAGTVTVGNDKTDLYVTITTANGWKVTTSHLYVGTEEDLLKNNKNLAPGQFPYKQENKSGVTEVVFKIPLAKIPMYDFNEGGDKCFIIALHAEVSGGVDAKGKSLGSQTAWGGDYVFTSPGNNNKWVALINHCIKDCDPAEIIIPPVTDGDECTTNYYIFSRNNETISYVVDPADGWILPGTSVPIKELWSSTLEGAYPAEWAAMMDMGDYTPLWIWDRQESWEHGFTGHQLVMTVTKFNISDVEKIVQNEIPFYFACDNAAVVFVNGEAVANTVQAFAGRYDAPAVPYFSGFGDAYINGDVWQHVYTVDIKPFLVTGDNTIEVLAANSDDNDGRWNTSNNPAGLIFATKFSVTVCEPVDPCVPVTDQVKADFNALVDAYVAELESGEDFIYYTKKSWADFLAYIESQKAAVAAMAANWKSCDGVFNFDLYFDPIKGSKLLKQTDSYGSVTATNDVVNFEVPNANGFWYAKLTVAQLEGGVTLAMFFGSSKNPSEFGEVFVQLEDGKIVIDLEGRGTFGAIAFNYLPEPKNGNIHSMNEFNHNNVAVIDCPEVGEEDFIYLYIHCKSWQFPAE